MLFLCIIVVLFLFSLAGVAGVALGVQIDKFLQRQRRQDAAAIKILIEDQKRECQLIIEARNNERHHA